MLKSKNSFSKMRRFKMKIPIRLENTNAEVFARMVKAAAKGQMTKMNLMYF